MAIVLMAAAAITRAHSCATRAKGRGMLTINGAIGGGGNAGGGLGAVSMTSNLGWKYCKSHGGEDGSAGDGDSCKGGGGGGGGAKNSGDGDGGGRTVGGESWLLCLLKGRGAGCWIALGPAVTSSELDATQVLQQITSRRTRCLELLVQARNPGPLIGAA